MKTYSKEEQHYLKTQKRVREIKGFYIHLSVYIISMIATVAINLIFVPQFLWFWFSMVGWGLAVLFHWLGVFGFSKLGVGKDWEERKIKEFMKDNK